LTDTPLTASLLNRPEKIEANNKRHPLQRIGQPDDIASMTVFLLSEQASWITGQTLNIDGGMSTLK
jgi:3-oxoacyl-[acyl-carrier protein] reductase